MILYRCGCGYEADHEDQMNQHIQDQHLDMVSDYVDEGLEDLIQRFFEDHVEIIEGD